ncbi:CASP-like protein 1E1 isoform X2 [Cajanus cajan]|uniref:CASP-like protein 1E1 isoform X2 n=1 Tax=Cajanus cajan TaxID=3821 RepID=UPI00098D7581|nr:CASP-like protein 1E1 isoform X2 [Cajanus cajan]
MEGESKGSFDVMDQGSENKGRKLIVGTCDLVLRLLAFVMTLVAAIVIGADKQTAIVSIKLLDSMPPLDLPVTAKWHYLSAFLRKGKGMEALISVIDALMVALLFSGNGAAIAIGLLGLQGNSHVHWNKVCNVFGKFCHQATLSLFTSLLGSTAFLLLLVVPPLLRLKRAN